MREDRISLAAAAPYALLHLAPLLAIYTGVTRIDWLVCGILYVARGFGLTAGYHRYFGHRSYKTSRSMQFLLALLGTTACQKGVLWWAGLHRIHHEESDGPQDVHSPLRHGFWWSHLGWFLCRRFGATPLHRIPDFARYPELRWLNRYWLAPPAVLAGVLTVLGGRSMFLIGFCLSTVLLYHGTYCINSVTHLFGSRPFPTHDGSRNNALVALVTLGEGWHNNHHYYMSCASQGFRWWEVDVTYYGIHLMELVGLAWDVRRPPQHVLEMGRRQRQLSRV